MKNIVRKLLARFSRLIIGKNKATQAQYKMIAAGLSGAYIFGTVAKPAYLQNCLIKSTLWFGVAFILILIAIRISNNLRDKE